VSLRCCDESFHGRPAGERPDYLKLVARRDVGGHAHFCQATEHDQRIMRASAEALRARQQEHQVRVAGWPGLDGLPGKIVEALVVAADKGVERKLAAVAPVSALDALSSGRCLRERPDAEQDG
jgi:hypothetical protein